MEKRYLYHNQGKNPCNGKALVYLPERNPEIGDLLLATDYQHLDGAECEPGDIVCGSCGSPIGAHPSCGDIAP